MRFSIATVALGLAVFGGRFGAYASAIPADLAESPSSLARDIAIEKPKRGVAVPVLQRAPAGGAPVPAPRPPAPVPKPNNPAIPKPVNPEPPAVPAPVVPKPLTPENVMPADVKPGQIVAADPVDPIVNPEPPKDIAAGAARQPGEKLQPRPNTLPKPANLRDAIDRGAANDWSDAVKAERRVCRKGKREERKKGELVAAFKKRSGPEYAQNWATWQRGIRASPLCRVLISNATLVFAQVNDMLAQYPEVTQPITIYIFGGISGLSINSRGSSGKTGDADYMFHPDTDETHKTAFQDAVQRVYSANQNTLATDYINDQVGNYFSDQVSRTIAQYSNEAAWQGSKLKIINAWWPIQLVNKMDRISYMIKEHDGYYQMKDMQDAVAFLKKSKRAIGNRKIGTDWMTIWGSLIGRDSAATKDMIATCAGLLQESYEGFADDIMQIVTEAEDSC